MPLQPERTQNTLQPVWQHLDAGGTVLTSNTSAAAFLAQQFALRNSRAAWLTPDILPFSAWLDRAFTQRLLNGQEQRALLSTHQEHTLWEKLLGRQAEFASLAQEAWSLVWTYAGGTHVLPTSGPPFLDWARRMEQHLRRNNWLTQAELPHTVRAGGNLLLYGFDTVTPAQLAATQNATVELYAPRLPQAEPPVRIGHADLFTSIAAAAQWAAAQLQRDPHARLAIVAPNVAAVRGELSRGLDRSIGHDSYRFSLGLPLSQRPIASIGLSLLEWSVAALPLPAITDILLSPYVASTPDCARYDARLRSRFRHSLPELSLREFVSGMESTLRRAPETWPALTSLYERARGARLASTPRESTMLPSRWAAFFRDYLDAWQLAAPATSGSDERQIERSWLVLFDEFATLDFSGDTLTHQQAVDTLRSMAHRTISAPASRDVPVEVIGPLEAAGSLFDAIYFLDASDASWPIYARSNPFLPHGMLRHFNMPNASPATDYAAMELVTARLIASAPQCIFTWPQRSDEQELQPSPLIAAFALDEAPQPTATLATSLVTNQPDDPPPAWDIARATLGAYDLKAQAACPFQGFARARLSGKPLESPDDGINPRERGNILHDLLEHMWFGFRPEDLREGATPPEPLRTHAALAKYIAEGTLHAFVTEHVQYQFAAPPRSDFERAYSELEQERLTELLINWFTLESQREPFTVLQAEQKHERDIAGVKFRVKLDRLDQLETGGLVLLDYKSGKNDKSTAWGPGPMTDAQMPLYTEFMVSSDEGRVAAVALAKVHHAAMAFDGRAEADNILPGVLTKDSLLNTEVRSAWRDGVTALATAFQQGESAVTPIKGACTYCEFDGLCRIGARTTESKDDDDE